VTCEYSTARLISVHAQATGLCYYHLHDKLTDTMQKVVRLILGKRNNSKGSQRVLKAYCLKFGVAPYSIVCFEARCLPFMLPASLAGTNRWWHDATGACWPPTWQSVYDRVLVAHLDQVTVGLIRL
jgi:hypothetical protein